MQDEGPCFKSIRWQQTLRTAIPSCDSSDRERRWDQRWQSAVLYPAKTSTTYQYRAQIISNIRTEFQGFILSKLKSDNQSWTTASNVLIIDDIELRRLSPD